jgi:DNA invertase Pin-like site-specific DNA recombinase
MMIQMVGVLSEIEKAMLKVRTKAGLDAARKEGGIGGRRPNPVASAAGGNQSFRSLFTPHIRGGLQHLD